MPLVKPSPPTVQLKLTLPEKLVTRLDAYAEFSSATRTRIVREALQRLFDAEKDIEWIENDPDRQE